LEINVQHLPIEELARFTGPMAPIPVFIPISWTTGPFTTTILAKDEVELNIDVTPLDASARMAGKYSGLAPAITAFTATISTV
jgi:hypothetical protein